MVANVEGGRRLVRVCRGMGQVFAVGEHMSGGRLVDLEPVHDPAGDRPVRAHGMGRLHPDQARCRGHVGLPAAPGDGVAVPQQEAVARGQRGRRVVDRAGAVEVVEDGPAAPVAHVEEQPPVPPPRLGRHQQCKVRREADTPLGVRGREADIGNGRVDPGVRVYGKVGGALQLPVGASIAEGLPIGVWGLGRYFEMGQWHDGIARLSGCLGEFPACAREYELIGVI